ncbi:hypothetical protein F52700_13529 [Fusarium sp. NRRL 52700]|nr:hypothetical protein F52700_13529 [Fusarium sp. NRRL 52700]
MSDSGDPLPDEQPLGNALLGKDIGQPMSTKKDPNPSFSMKRQTTGHFHHLSRIEGQLHKGFHEGTTARLDVRPCPGLHVRPEISVGQFTQAQVHLQFLVRNEVNYEDQVMQSMAHVKGLSMKKPKLGEYKQAEDVMSKKDTAGGSINQSSSNHRVAWTSTQNENREFANLQRASEPNHMAIDTSVKGTDADRNLAEYFNQVNERTFQDVNPTCVFASVSEYTRKIATDNEKDWPDVLLARREKKQDPDAYAINLVKHKEAFPKLMEQAVSLIGLAIGTPVALVEFAKHATWVLSLIVVDEAAQLTENLSFALQTEWQSALCTFIRDNRQFRPLGLTVEQRDFKAISFQQGRISLFHRMDEMTVVNHNHTPATRILTDWVAKEFAGFHTKSSTIMIRPDHFCEQARGTSFYNEGYGNFTMQLIIQLYRQANHVQVRDESRRASVLIIAAYQSQMHDYEFLLDQITSAELPKSLIEVRTIDDSLSHEADYVFADLSRTEKAGFLKDPQRINVAATRARIASFIIGPGIKVPLVHSIRQLMEFLEKRHACIFEPECVRCDGDGHSTRNCPQAEEDAISVFANEPITANDGIERNALKPARIVPVNETKRVKKNKAERKDRFKKPETQNTKMLKEYSDAMEALNVDDDTCFSDEFMGCLSMKLLIRPDNTEVSKSGSSVSSPANANFAVKLVVQLYRDAALVDARDFSERATVLILTPYKEQKYTYELLLRQLTKAEVPKDLVEVRTVDDSPSHEADVIIFDLVRTVKKGFINESPRMNVAMTRGRLVQFVIGPSKKTPLEWPLNYLVAFLEERSAVINLRDRCHWYLMCQNCCQPGHLATNCKFKPKCVRYDGAPHATRNCPRAEEDAISTSASEPITAEDGIQRDVLNPPRVNFSDSKRSKKNSASREKAFAKPNKHQDAMRKACRNALQAIRKVRKDQDVQDLGIDEQVGVVSDEEPDNEVVGNEEPDDDIRW